MQEQRKGEERERKKREGSQFLTFIYAEKADGENSFSATFDFTLIHIFRPGSCPKSASAGSHTA